MLEANEHTFAFGLAREPSCERRVSRIAENPSLHILRICRTIIGEVRNHLSPEDVAKFIKLIIALTTIDEDFLIPFEIVFKYESKHFKPADAFIAVYPELTGAYVLVSENRRFLMHHSILPLKVLTTEKCLSLIKHLSR
ncbi:MAG: hypothetical protein NC916_00085 [Candidatus Omnitrophica bacterium]|nr:hypothetical protein [Candidatus Omnitrophota bacterium]